MLGLKNSHSKYDHYKDFIRMYFSRENFEMGEYVYKQLVSLENNNLKNNKKVELVIINTVSSLSFFEYCFDKVDKNEIETQTTIEIETNILKAYLIINESFFKDEEIAFETSKQSPLEINFSCTMLTQSFPYFDLVDYKPIKILTTQMIKAILLFEHLESTSKTHTLLHSFLEYYKVSNWKEYLLKIFPLMMAVINKKNEAHTLINIEDDEEFKNNCAFFDTLTVIDTELISKYDFLKIRNQPLAKINDSQYLIIFDLFLLEKVYKGLYFKLNEINKNLSPSEQIKSFKSYFGNEISEKMMLYKILEDTFYKKYITYTGEEIKNLNINAEPDYYIRNGKYLFLFESKDFLIPAEIKKSWDFNAYEKILKEKLYYVENEEGKIINKAIKQLFTNIERVLTKKLSFDTAYSEKSILIYPIIVIHDTQYNIPGLNNLINYWAKNELAKLNALGLDINRIKPITIIDIDTLIYHQDIFRTGKIKLNITLDKYFEYVSFDEKKQYKDLNQLSIRKHRTALPFSLFLDWFIDKNKLHKIPKFLQDKLISISSV
ncbi:MAG: hypothetical protein H7282_09310 [Cytophagaceae bacterium]|nr:hypothetical protein [Cytophagaceae bacterium]